MKIRSIWKVELCRTSYGLGGAPLTRLFKIALSAMSIFSSCSTFHILSATDHKLLLASKYKTPFIHSPSFSYSSLVLLDDQCLQIAFSCILLSFSVVLHGGIISIPVIATRLETEIQRTLNNVFNASSEIIYA